MRCFDDHHDYEVTNFDDPNTTQHIQFIHKAPSSDPTAPAGTLVTVVDGTTNEQVLAVLIHRLKGQGAKFPCRQNSIAITKLEEALMWLENRTQERKERGVEGKALA